MLYKYPDQWSNKQELRAFALFEKFPDIEKAYNLSIQFRDWYSKKNIGKSKLYIERELHQWYEDINLRGSISYETNSREIPFWQTAVEYKSPPIWTWIFSLAGRKGTSKENQTEFPLSTRLFAF